MRREGAGRKQATESDPGLEIALDSLVDPDSRGDPESPLRWTVKSTRQPADTLIGSGHAASPNTVRALLHRLGFHSSPTPRRSKVPSTPTVTPSSAT